MKLKKSRIILLLVTLFIIATAGKSLGLTWPAGKGIAQGWGSGWFCAEHEATLDPKDGSIILVDGKPVQKGNLADYKDIIYGGGSTEAADITVAYAKYLGRTGGNLQNVIWASKHNEGQKVGLSDARVKEYKEIYEGIFSKSKDVLTGTTSSANIKVLVDRTSGTYTVGPYKIDLAVSGVSSGLKAKLQTEIKTGKEGVNGAYAVFSGIEGINGTIVDLVYSDGSRIAPQNGLGYGFPDLGKEFYIKFKPNNDGAILSTGNPSFKVKFLTNVKGTVTKYTATGVTYSTTLETSWGSVVSTAKLSGKAKVDFPNPPAWNEGLAGKYYYQDQTVNVEVTIEMKTKHHSSGQEVTETKTEKTSIPVTVTRIVLYDNNGGWKEVGRNTDKTPTPSVPGFSGTVTAKASGGYESHLQKLCVVGEATTEWQEPTSEPQQEEEEHNIVIIEPGDGEGELTGGFRLPGTSINMQIGGTVWLETVEQKTGNYNGRYKATKTDNDSPFAGIQVDLYQADGTLVATTTTDKNGKYRFYGKVAAGKSLLNPLRQYYVVFEYDGQRYQATYYRNDISKPGGFSNAREVNRETYNAKFTTIYSDPGNYEDNKRAYAIDHKIKKDDGTYATTGEKNEEGKEIALTYEDVYNKFLELATAGDAGEPKQGDNNKTWSNRSYTDILNDNNGLKKWLSDKGVNNEYESIKAFILDSLMKSSTQKDEKGETVLYPKYDKFVVKDLFDTNSTDYKRSTTTTLKVGDTFTYLYTVNYDMARYVDFGLCNRVKADIRLQKDVYKTTLIVNGKKEEYMYEQRDLSANPNNNNWDIRIRAADSLYNGTTAYNRDVRPSEYLVGEEDVGVGKTLQAYVTYKIAFKNAGDVNVKVKEIVDYYDAEGYTYDGSNPNIADNTYIGDYEGKKLKDLTVSTTGLKNRTRSAENKLQADGYKYEELYLTGMDDILTPGNVAWVYVTFKVNNDEKGKVQIDYTKDPYTTSAEEIKNAIGIGKQNIAEISAYETYYRGDGKNEKFVVPNYLNPVKDKNGKITDYELVNTDVSGKVAGLIDYDSNPGSLSKLDLDKDGNLKVEKTSKKIEGKAGIIASDRQEDDTSQAPNIRLIIDPDDGEVRRVSGYVFDDKRTENNDSTGNATIGNGQYDEGEDKINGVRVQLVEIISEIDNKGVSTHKYTTEEKVWESFTYDPNTNKLVETDNSRYSSGDGRAKIIVNGPKGTIFEVKDNEKLEYNDGYYTFKSLPAGDFYIRFVYGDHDDTVLTNSEENDVNKLLKAKGRNAKSYNGQDYKSTVYQKGIDQSKDYYDIKGYRNYNVQNYTLDDGKLNNGTDTKSMYYYDINASQASEVVSDAKDVWYYRTNSNNYSKGADGKTLLNKRAEVLASFEKLASFAPSADEITYYSYDYETDGGKIYDYYNTAMDYFKNQQRTMVDALKANTYMVSQSGIINTEIEIARDKTQYDLAKKDTKTLEYTVDNVNFGLTERPEAQLKLNKEVSNYNLTLQNGQILFDSNKSVNNLSYSKHNQHTAEKENGLFKEGEPRVARPGDGNSEIIQNYVDNEMLSNATVNVIYKLSVENVGETDYKDTEFYYTGKENNKDENISKTKAVRIVDYVANSIKFDKASQQSDWVVANVDELMPSKDALKEDENFVNRLYNPEISTYNTIITTEALGDELKPGEKREITLALSSETAGNNGENNLVYNNMAEIIATSNDFGRRCVYSIPGNEEMADQNLGDNAASGTLSSADRIQVSEIDADSSQKIILMPPTGDEKDTTEYTVGLTLILSITLAAVAGIKNLLIK